MKFFLGEILLRKGVVSRGASDPQRACNTNSWRRAPRHLPALQSSFPPVPCALFLYGAWPMTVYAQTMDFGDAPDSYGRLSANDGAPTYLTTIKAMM